MTQHAELIRRLETNAALMPSDAAVALEYKAAAEALKEQAVEIELLRKDAALVAARERERCANHIEDCEPPIAVHGARVEIGITTRIAYANSIRALNTEDAAIAAKGGSDG